MLPAALQLPHPRIQYFNAIQVRQIQISTTPAWHLSIHVALHTDGDISSAVTCSNCDMYSFTWALVGLRISQLKTRVMPLYVVMTNAGLEV